MDPNVKTITLDARKYMLVGLAFLAAGLFVLILHTLQPAPRETGIAILGGMSVLLGAIFMCIRFGVMLDRKQRTITTWWGLLVPFNLTRHPISQAHFVSISREERVSYAKYSPPYEVFPMRLERAGADSITIQELTVHEPRDYDKARQLAEDVVKFIQLGIRDRSSGNEIIREAGALDQSLQQRLRRAVRSMPLPAQPPQARAIFKYGATRTPTTIEIPPVGRSGRWFLKLILIAGVMAIVSELFARLGWYPGDMAMRMATGMPTLFTYVLALVVLGGSLPLLLRTAILRERLVVSPDNLIVTRSDIFGTKTTRLTGGEIEELEVTHARRGIYGGYATFGGGTDRVVIRSDRGSIGLGAALSDPEEIKWLRDVLVHVLTSARTSSDIVDTST